VSNYETILLFLSVKGSAPLTLIYSLYLDKFLEFSSLAGKYVNLLQSNSFNQTYYFMYSPEYIYFTVNQVFSVEAITEIYYLYVYDSFEFNLTYSFFEGIS